MIDPTCGSGHFLLGGFHRLFDEWATREPGTQPARRGAEGARRGGRRGPQPVRRRHRALPAAGRGAAGRRACSGWREAPDFKLNVAIGDSLLHGTRFG